PHPVEPTPNSLHVLARQRHDDLALLVRERAPVLLVAEARAPLVTLNRFARHALRQPLAATDHGATSRVSARCSVDVGTCTVRAISRRCFPAARIARARSIASGVSLGFVGRPMWTPRSRRARSWPAHTFSPCGVTAAPAASRWFGPARLASAGRRCQSA